MDWPRDSAELCKVLASSSSCDGSGGPCLQKRPQAQKWICGEEIKDGGTREVREQGCQWAHPNAPQKTSKGPRP